MAGIVGFNVVKSKKITARQAASAAAAAERPRIAEQAFFERVAERLASEFGLPIATAKARVAALAISARP